MLSWDSEINDVYWVISKYFIIVDYFLVEDAITFYIKPKDDLKKDFILLYDEIRGRGLKYIPILDKENENVVIKIKKFTVKSDKGGFSAKHFMLLLATLCTVMIDGYLRSNNPYLASVISGYNPLLMTVTFTIALLGIIGTHELGHKIMLHIHRMKAGWPYFIPGVPGVLPTLGAVITQEDIPPNRDRLFDLGLAGPIAGLLTTIVVTFYAVNNAPIISMDKLSELQSKFGGEVTWFPVPLLYYLIQSMIRPVPKGYVVLVDPLTWAAIVGMLITALNIFPAWQLDGGHLARATLGAKYHNYATLISIFILFITGYYLMALFILFMHLMTGGLTVRPLDDLSPISTTRKVLFIISWIIAIICLPIII